MAAQGSGDTSQHQFARITAMLTRFIAYLIYIYLIFVEIFLGLGFFLLLFGANRSTQFVAWIYSGVQNAMSPFRGIFQSIQIPNTTVNAVFEPSILFAMIIYGIVAIALHGILDWLTAKIRQINVENRLAAQHASYREAAAAHSSTPPNVMGDAAAGTLPPPNNSAAHNTEASK